MPTYPNYRNANAHGVPAFQTIDTYFNQFLLAGSEPGIQQPVRLLLADSTTLEPFSVVGLNSSGRLVLAQWNATAGSEIRPIGVLMHRAVSGASNTTILGEVTLEGNFNTDDDSPLVWHSTFDTVAKKQQYNGDNSRLRFRSRRSTSAV